MRFRYVVIYVCILRKYEMRIVKISSTAANGRILKTKPNMYRLFSFRQKSFFLVTNDRKLNII